LDTAEDEAAMAEAKAITTIVKLRNSIPGLPGGLRCVLWTGPPSESLPIHTILHFGGAAGSQYMPSSARTEGITRFLAILDISCQYDGVVNRRAAPCDPVIHRRAGARCEPRP
jgi:hypothetical protein